jgi:hypothetical protein
MAGRGDRNEAWEEFEAEMRVDRENSDCVVSVNGIAAKAYRWMTADKNRRHRLGGKPAAVRPTTRDTSEDDWLKYGVLHPGIVERYFVDGVEFDDGTCDKYMEACYQWRVKNGDGRLTKRAVGTRGR